MSNLRNNLPSRFVRRLGSTRVNINNREEENFSFPHLPHLTNDRQRKLQHFFEDKIKNETPHLLKKGDFANGTLRIQKPGVYKLTENIDFNPKNQFPTTEQYDQYPIGRHGPYHLGFFAAIAVETDGVIIDLNGFSIKQSRRHSLLQRFFSIIELANSPFIPKQGPHKFIDNYKAASHCLIMNGSLVNSSHHGIHGNLCSNIIIHNVKIIDFEVAAIAINGGSNGIITQCQFIGKNRNIDVLSSFSQAIFTSRALVNLKETDTTIYSNLDKDLQKAYEEIMNHKKQSTYFENKTGQYDGNMYGIVLNVKGVVINDFLKERNDDHINDDFLIQDVSIKNIETHPVEIVSLALTNQSKTTTAYGGKQMVGVFGDVFDIEKVLDKDRKYNGNSLSHAQLYIAEKYPTRGSINIEKNIIEWAKNKLPLPENTNLLPLGDSMGHVMKGNIGIFISGGKNITLKNITVDNVTTNGVSVGTSSLLREDQKYFQGANSYGLLMTATDKDTVLLDNVEFKNIVSKNKGGIAKKIEVL